VKELMKMDRGWCASALAFRFEKGKADGVGVVEKFQAWRTETLQ
jgi:hypothetical protein